MKVDWTLGLQSTDGAVVDHLQVHLVSHQFSDVVDAIFNHGGPVKKRQESEQQLLDDLQPKQTARRICQRVCVVFLRGQEKNTG